ncbi:hypothetical protein M0813_01826 [Anaeramoeba flamelloides]|uniref:BTB domain-containing protein n=1 Tax=Anaeramoeba flamelloides TaxID=1746091 RepID=A0ABQ8YX84_9EUKA|nr:hypothetical protein M0813_01826 [Anaeramoeba flamelloides]
MEAQNKEIIDDNNNTVVFMSGKYVKYRSNSYQTNNLPIIHKNNNQPILQISPTGNGCECWVFGDSHLNYCTGNSNKIFKLDDTITTVQSGPKFSIVLTDTGRVFGLGENIGLIFKNYELIRSMNNPQEITFFQDQSEEIIDIACGKLGIGNWSIEDNFVCVMKGGVKNVWSGVYANHCFLQTCNGKLYSWGRNYYGQLGLNDRNDRCCPTEVSRFENKDINKICCGSDNTLFLVDKKLYICGDTSYSEIKSWKITKILEDYDFKDISVGCNHFLVLTVDNEIFLWGDNSYNQLYSHTKCIKKPTRLNLQNIQSTDHISIYTGGFNTFITISKEGSLISDLKLALKRKEFTDIKVKGQQFHSIMLNIRFPGYKIKSLQNILSKYTEKEIETFLIWLYTEKVNNYDLISKITNEIGVMNFLGLNIKNQIGKLYTQNSSKDFSILSKDGEVKVHKFILFIRTELFRFMFQIQNFEKNDKITDYTNLSKKSLQIIIKFLYTDTINSKKINLNIIEQIHNASDFYQFHSNCNFLSQLNKYILKK